MLITTGPIIAGEMLPPVPASDTLWANVPIAIRESNISDFVFPVAKGARVLGRMSFVGESGVGPLMNSSMAVLVQSADGRDIGEFPVAGVESDGKFRTVGLAPGKYVLQFARPNGWILTGVKADGHETIGRPIVVGTSGTSVDITFAKGTAPRLSGVVRDQLGQQLSGDVSVCVFPVDRDLWVDFGPEPDLLKSVRLDRDGRFAVDLAPGVEYFVAARRALPETWRHAKALSELAISATRIRGNAGDALSRDLVVR